LAEEPTNSFIYSKLKEYVMDKNKALMLASVIFGIVAVLHLLRAVLRWNVTFNGFKIPLWLSYVAVAVAGYLSWLMYSAGKK